MYAFIEGIIEDKTANSLVVSANGVGYEILCTQNTLVKAPKIGESMRVYTYLSVREDAMELMGFWSKEEKEMFLLLRSVSGIGSKSAISILSSINLNELTSAIVMEDIGLLSKAPGIGKKTAQRIALELKDKVSKAGFASGSDDGFSTLDTNTVKGASDEAMLALQALGYTQQEAYSAVRSVKKELKEDAKPDDIVRIALRGMMKG